MSEQNQPALVTLKCCHPECEKPARIMACDDPDHQDLAAKLMTWDGLPFSEHTCRHGHKADAFDHLTEKPLGIPSEF